MKNLQEQCLCKAHKQKKPSVPVQPELHQKTALVIIAKPLNHATKVIALQALGRLQATHTHTHTRA